MRVILLQDVANVGKKYEIKDVKPGFARNFLFVKEMAKPATATALKWLEAQKTIEEKKAEENLKKVEDFVSQIDGQEVVMQVKLGDEGQLFESINVQKIQEKLKEMGFELKKNQILLENPIKELGEFPIKVKFEHNLEAEIRAIITEEK